MLRGGARRPTLRAGIYTRVSQDASGVARSPREQEAESRRDCERNGWAVVEVYVDNDRSASRYARKARPAFAQLMADIAASAIDIVVVWEASRLARDLEVYATLATVCRSADVRLSYNGRVFDLEDPTDAFNVGLDILVAERYSGETRKRILRNQRTNAEAGRPHGKRVFGYRRLRDPATGVLLGQEPDPVEAPIVVELFARIAGGESIFSALAWLNATIPAPQAATVRQDGKPSSGKWTHPTVRRMLTNRAYLGHRTHRGQVVVENAWAAIVDETTFYRVAAILADPARRRSHDVTTKHLLAGLIRCGVCGDRCTFRHGRQRNETQYRCKDGGHVAVDAEHLEACVRLLITEALARPDALAVFAPPDVNLAGVRAEHKALVARLDEADEALAAGEISARAVGVLEAKIKPRLDELGATLARARRDIPAPIANLAQPMTAAEVAARFDALTLEQRRLVVRTLLAECVLRPAPPSRRRPDLGLRFRWAGVGDPVDA